MSDERNPHRYQPRLERAGEQTALLRGVCFGTPDTGFAVWLVTPWQQWIAAGVFDDLAGAARRLTRIGAELEDWGDSLDDERPEGSYDETFETPLVWLLLLWEHLSLDTFNVLWGVPYAF